MGCKPIPTSTISLSERRRREERPCKATSKFHCWRGYWPLYLGQAVLGCANYDVYQATWDIDDFLNGVVADK